MTLDEFRHQAIQCASAGSDQLQNLLALALTFYRPLNSLDLAFDTPDARERLRFVFCCM
jgi:hypothetical protein